MRATSTRLMKNSPRIQALTQQHQRGHEGDAGGEPVHVVEQVEGVRDAHHPDDGEGHVERVVVEEVGADPARDEDDGGQDLAGELEAHLEAVAQHVVEEADQERDRGAEEERHQLPLDAVRLLQHGHRPREVRLHPGQPREDGDAEVAGEDHEGERRPDRDPADAGRRRLVDLARARLVHHPVAAREPARRRHEGGGQGEGDEEHADGDECGRHGVVQAAFFAARSSR